MAFDRETFETWAKAQGLPVDRVISDERYCSFETEWAWRAVRDLLAPIVEPGWFLADAAINAPMREGLRNLMEFARVARFTNAVTRKDGIERTFEADWIKHMRRTDGETGRQCEYALGVCTRPECASLCRAKAVASMAADNPCKCGAYGGPESHARWCKHARGVRVDAAALMREAAERLEQIGEWEHRGDDVSEAWNELQSTTERYDDLPRKLRAAAGVALPDGGRDAG